MTIVVVCGWMDGKAAIVDKYAALYRDMGFKTFTLLSRTADFYCNRGKVQKQALEPFLTFLESNGLSQRDDPVAIVPHIMSNGGSWAWTCFQDHLTHAGVKFTIPAIVLDSATSQPGKEADTNEAFGVGVRNRVLRRIVTSVLGFAQNVLIALFKLCGGHHPFDQSFECIIEQSSQAPKLFLYSTKDNLIPASHFAFAIETATSLGTSVTAVDFETSLHVNHYSMHPERYVKAIHEFLPQYVTVPV